MAKPRYWDVWRAVKKNARTINNQSLADLFRESPLRELQLAPLDSRYRVVDIDTWKLILAYNGVDAEKYKSEEFDCDNFAVCLSGDVAQRWHLNSVGIVVDFSAQHAYNCVVTPDGIFVVEPQTDQVFRTDTPYQAQHGFVLFA